MNLLLSSFFVSLFSYLESKMINECWHSQHEDFEISVSIEKLPGMNNIHKAKKYLVEELNTSFSFDTNPYWEEILMYNKIRNCIVHKSSRVLEKELKKNIEDDNDLSLEKAFGSDYLTLSNSFCEKALSTISTFLTSLLYHRQADKIS